MAVVTGNGGRTEGSNDPPCAVVIFGATGDLTRRKLLPAFHHLFLEGKLPEGFVILGAGRTPMDDRGFRSSARAEARSVPNGFSMTTRRQPCSV